MLKSLFQILSIDVRLGSKADMCVAKKAMSALPLRATGLATSYLPMEGSALLLCPARLSVDLLRNSEGIIDIDAEIPDSALYLGVAEKKLHGSQIPSAAAVDLRRFSSPQ
jgi:hypothetical protein